MAALDGPAHLVSLKVMRISRPELASAWHPFYSSSPSFSAHSSASILSLQGNTPLPGHPKTLRDFTSTTDVLTLPSSFGSIQLGETFSSCLCVNNETRSDVEITQVKVEMQTSSSKVVLQESDAEGSTLPGGDTLETVVHHEIKELGQHVLACTVTYRLPPGARPVPGAAEEPSDPSLQTFRKFYKFAVTNPLSVKTKVHSVKSPTALLSPTEREKIFLEVHIQNLTQYAICFERMRLECTDGWEAVDGNMLPQDGDQSDEDEISIFSGPMALMQPQDMRQYVYILTPKNAEVSALSHIPGSVIPLGRLDIFWRSTFGEPGRLLTSMLSRRVPVPPVHQPASAVPPHLKRISGAVPSRPHSPSISSLSQSRPGTPPPGGHRGSVGSIVAPILPPAPQPAPLPDIEAQLIVRYIPRADIKVAKPFSIQFSVILSSNSTLARPNLRRNVTLAIQNIKRRRLPPPVVSLPIESFSPRLPSSGFSTPASGTTVFNYALAHQKILAASSRSVVEPTLDTEDNSNVLPPPYYEVGSDDPNSSANNVSFIGPSAIFLPACEINYDGQTKVQVTQDFVMEFIGLQSGFSVVGGIRILLVEDTPLQEDGEGAKLSKPRTLKEYEVVGEVWVE